MCTVNLSLIRNGCCLLSACFACFTAGFRKFKSCTIQREGGGGGGGGILVRK